MTGQQNGKQQGLADVRQTMTHRRGKVCAAARQVRQLLRVLVQVRRGCRVPWFRQLHDKAQASEGLSQLYNICKTFGRLKTGPNST